MSAYRNLCQSGTGGKEGKCAAAVRYHKHGQLNQKQRGGWRTDDAVEAVEGGVEVETWSQAVHLQKHLSQEQSQEQELCIVWNQQTTHVGFKPDHYIST